MNHDAGDVPVASRLYGEWGMRELDRRAMAQPGMGGGRLMEFAGRALFQALQQRFPGRCRVGLLCGPGNNGGDGFVLARLALEAGLEVRVHAGGSGSRADSDGQRARRLWLEAGGTVQPLETFSPGAADVWVDCLFGIGLGRAIGEPYAGPVEALNASGVPVLAADVPSGVDIDTGAVRGPAVRAWVTVTMIADKLGLHTGAGVDHAGEVLVADLGVPEDLHRGAPFSAVRLTPRQVSRMLPKRRPGAHKGDCGHVLVVGGAPGYSGAARLAAAAALRSGAGLVTLATHPDHAAFANLDRPELMVRPVRGAADIAPLLARADVVAVGPGLGQDAWGRGLWLAVADRAVPMVVDADALNLLAQMPRRRGDWVLTPHPGEAARMLGTTAAEVNADRTAALNALSERFGGTVLLKGAGSLVTGDPPACVTGGHPGMATGGMGDVLTGIVAALRAQGLSAEGAARAGAAWHLGAAELASVRLGGGRGMLAADVIAALPEAGGEPAK